MQRSARAYFILPSSFQLFPHVLILENCSASENTGQCQQFSSNPTLTITSIDKEVFTDSCLEGSLTRVSNSFKKTSIKHLQTDYILDRHSITRRSLRSLLTQATYNSESPAEFNLSRGGSQNSSTVNYTPSRIVLLDFYSLFLFSQ